MKEKVIIIGDGGHSKVLIDILLMMDKYDILGVTSKKSTDSTFFGVPILGTDEILNSYLKKGYRNIAIGIGGFINNNLRTQIFNKYTKKGFNIINVIHPSSIISNSVKLGKGVVIFSGVVINTEVVINDNTIIATGATIDHESIIEKNCLISAGVTIGANCIIEEGVLCALGSKVVSAVTVGSRSLVAAGAVVVNDILENSKVFGVPAKEKSSEKIK